MEKKNGVEFFYRSLVTNGIIDRMEYLALPVLGGSSIADAIQNLKDGGVSITNMGNTALYEVVVNKGLARIAAVSSATDIISIIGSRANILSEFHFSFCTTDSVPNNGTVYTTPQEKGLESIEGVENLNSMFFGFKAGIRAMGLRNLFGKSELTKQQFFDLDPFMYPGIGPSVAPPLTVLHGDKNFANIPTTFVACASNNVISMSCGEQQVQSEALTPTDTTKNTEIAFRTDYAHVTTEGRRVYFNLLPLVIDNVWFAQHYGILSFGRSLTSEQNIQLQKSMSELIEVLNA